jgi:molybdenum cofactor biosynthesis enzyme MoaA
MDLLDRTDICICPWTDYTLGSSYIGTCCWSCECFAIQFPDTYKGGPWDGDMMLSDDMFVQQRKLMLEQGSSACTPNCPFKNKLPTVRQQFQRLYHLDAKSIAASEAIVADIRSGVFRPTKPLNLTVVPSLVCNQNCSFCIIDNESNQRPGIRLAPTAEQIANVAPLYEDCVYFTSCGGDTFGLKEDVIDMFYAPLKGRLISSCVTTNARGLTLAKYEKYFVRDQVMNSATVSLTTLNQDTYRLVYNGQDLDTILRNVQDITGKYKDHKLITLASVVLTLNIPEIPELVLFAHRCGFKSVMFIPLNPMHLAKRGFEFLDPRGQGFSLDLYRKFHEAKARLASLKRSHPIGIYGLDHVTHLMETRLEAY